MLLGIHRSPVVSLYASDTRRLPLRLFSAATTPPDHPLTDNGSSQDDSPSIYLMPLGLL